MRELIAGTFKANPAELSQLWASTTPAELGNVTQAFLDITWRYINVSLTSKRIEFECREPSITQARYDDLTRSLADNVRQTRELGAQLKAAREECITAYKRYEEFAYERELAYLEQLFGNRRPIAREVKVVARIDSKLPPNATNEQRDALHASAEAEKNEDPDNVKKLKKLFVEDPDKEKRLKKLFAASRKPDANLGQAEVGPSREKITYASALKLLSAMGINERSVFIDIGCAHGLVTFGAALLFDAARSMGVDLAEDPINWAQLQRAKILTGDEKQRVRFYKGDITQTWDKDFDSATHVYAFSKDFPPEVLYAILERLYENRATWRVFASGRDLGTMLNKIDEWATGRGADKTRAVVMQFLQTSMARRPEPVSVTLQFSGEGHNIYLFDNNTTATR